MRHRSPSSPIPSLLALAALAAPAASQRVTFLLGPPTGPADVAVFDEGSGVRLAAPGELQGIELLPIDFSGRTRLEELRDDRPHLRAGGPGGRVLLPFEQGSLYRYRRPEAVGATYGFLWIDGGGEPHVVHERLEASGLDPWETKVAVAPDGSAFLAATAPAFGGDVLEVDLASATAELRTGAEPPLAVLPSGLALLADWGVVLTSQGVLRFDRLAGAEVEAVPIGAGAPAFLGDGVACSAGGGMVALAAGADPANAHVWGLERTGAAQQLSMSAMPLSGAGYLPEYRGGPYLALSPTADTCLWRTEGLASAEAWVRPIQLAAPPPVQVTSNAFFEDTLDSTGEFGFLQNGTAMMLVGETDPLGVDAADVYQVTVDPTSGATTVTNLSNTSGQLAPPFSKGSLSSDGIWQVPGQDALLVFNDLPSNQGELGAVHAGVVGMQLLRTGVKGVQSVERAGTDVAIVAQDSSGTSELYSVPFALDALTVQASLGAGFTFSTLVGRSDGQVGVLLDVPGGGQWIGRVHLPTSTAEVLIETALPLGGTIGHTPGRLAFTVDFSPQRSAGVTWGTGGTFGLYAFGGRPGTLLPHR